MKSIVNIAFVIFVVFFADVSLAETYSCSASLAKYGRPNESSIRTYNRIGSVFLKISKYGKYKFNVLHESEDTIIIYEVNQFSVGASLFTALINKKTLEFIENYSSFGNLESNNSPQTTGTCIVN